MPRKEGSGGLIFIKDFDKLASLGFEVYIHRSDESLRENKMDGLETNRRLKKKKVTGLGEQSFTWAVFKED